MPQGGQLIPDVAHALDCRPLKSSVGASTGSVTKIYRQTARTAEQLRSGDTVASFTDERWWNAATGAAHRAIALHLLRLALHHQARGDTSPLSGWARVSRRVATRHAGVRAPRCYLLTR